jgi:hypothetical protein
MTWTTPPGAPRESPVFEWAGGTEAFSRLTRIFYGHVKTDPILAPVFAEMTPKHPRVGCAVVGASIRRAGNLHATTRRVSAHARPAPGPDADRAAARPMGAADGRSRRRGGLPTDSEFRSAFVSYMEWGSRIALANSQLGAQRPPCMPVPHWDWGTAGPPPSVSLGSGPPPNAPPQPSAAGRAPGSPTDPPGERDIRPLFTDRNRTAMRWAFDLGDVDAVRQRTDAILDQLDFGRMFCYGAWLGEQVAVFRRWVETGKLD